MQKDAARQMGEARLDAAQSSLLREGSVPVREQALATRLQTQIQDEAAQAMRNAQALYNRADMEQYMGRSNARAQKTAAAGTCSPASRKEATPCLNGKRRPLRSKKPQRATFPLPQRPPEREGNPA